MKSLFAVTAILAVTFIMVSAELSQDVGLRKFHTFIRTRGRIVYSDLLIAIHACACMYSMHI